jgi:hypothetical protein
MDLLAMFTDQVDDSDIRIKAYLTVMGCACPMVVSKVEEVLGRKEESKQGNADLRSPHFSYFFSSIMNLTLKYFKLICKDTDYSWDNGRFLVFASCVTISNPDSLSSSETWVNSGI